jgi:hypothetical protein
MRNYLILIIVFLFLIKGCAVFFDPVYNRIEHDWGEFSEEFNERDSCDEYLIASLIIYRETKMKFPDSIENAVYFYSGDSLFSIGTNHMLHLIDSLSFQELDTTIPALPKVCYTEFDSVSIKPYNCDSLDLYTEKHTLNDTIDKYVRRTMRLLVDADTVSVVDMVEFELTKDGLTSKYEIK